MLQVLRAAVLQVQGKSAYRKQNELVEGPAMAELDREAYLEQRVDDQLRWLGQSSRRSKKMFIGLSIVEILLGTAITVGSPFIGGSSLGRTLIAIAGGGVAITGSVLALTRSQENWIRYRSLAEQLKREKYLFTTDTPPYGGEPEQSLHHFVNQVESLMLEERGAWARSHRGDLGEGPGQLRPPYDTQS